MDDNQKPNLDEIRRLVESALEEDDAFSDATTAYLNIGNKTVNARIVAKAEGVIAGLDTAMLAFDLLDRATRFDPAVADGARVTRGDIVTSIGGKAAAVLGAERVALNFLQRLSGVATLTAAYVNAVSGTDTKILDTRKTTPLFRRLEKYAVRMGGGENHRFSLGDMLLVKENHFRSLGGADRFVDHIANVAPPLGIEVEVDSIEFLRELLGAPVDRIMLDNFTPGEVVTAVKIVADYRKNHADFNPAIEVSGGITLATIQDFAAPGVDYISVGALTHSAPSLDLSLEVLFDGQ
jgi:nicotinate-nucleotide pyrophosphorylase (carboxylating)